MSEKIIMHLSLDKIRIDCDTQSREKTILAKINEYAEKMLMGEVFRPAVVYYNSRDYILSDGFHRYFAYKKIGSPGMDCEVRQGSVRDAQFYAFEANNGHGMPPTAADIRRNVIRLLTDFEWGSMTQLEIAKKCGCSQQKVSKIKQELSAPKPNPEVSNDKKDSKPAEDSKPVKEPKESKKADTDKATSDVEAELIEQNELLIDTVVTLETENHNLTDRLAVTAMEATPEEKALAQETITELRSNIRLLELDLKSITQSRNMYQSENAQLKKQITILMNKIKKIEAK